MRAISIFALVCMTAASAGAQVSNTVFPNDGYYNCMIKAYASYNECLANRGDYPANEWPQVCDKGFNNLTKLCAKPQNGSFYLKYVVVAILYALPGNNSNSAFSDSSTSGSSSTFTDSEGETYKYGLTFSAGGFAKEGFNIGSGSDSSTSEQLSTSMTSASGFQSKSPKDVIDHSQDEFFLWLNAEFTPQLSADHRSVTMQVTSGGGPFFDIIAVSVAELRNPALISPAKLAPQTVRNPDGSVSTYPGLKGLTPADYQHLLALDPLASGDPTAQPQDLKRYFDTLDRPVVQGPDQAGGSAIAAIVNLANTNSQTLTYTTTDSNSIGVSFNLGAASFDYSDTIRMSTAQATTSGTAQQTSVTLGSSTVGCCSPAAPAGETQAGQCHVDVYEDMLFQTYAFIPEPYGCTGILPRGVGKGFTHPQAIQGQLLTAQGQPKPNTPVTVKLPNGHALKLFTDSKGRFSLYEAPEGRATIRVGNAIKTVTIKKGISQRATLRQH